jgi:ferric-dicitrate binding protein FerR (iron transport regulator)
MENRVWYLFSKKLTGDCTAAELLELNNLLSKYPHMHDELQALESIWQQNHLQDEHSNHETAFEQLQQRLDAHQLEKSEIPSIATIPQIEEPDLRTVSQIPKKVWTILAAAAAIALVIFVWPPSENDNKGTTEKTEAVAASNNQVSTRPGSRSKIVLPDGTQVWLNADSKLTYANDFGKSSRDVTLSGEAYFDVVSNKKVPFFIHTSKIKVKVTGTTFNVRAYPNETKSETSLIHGRVEVTVNNQPDKTYYLKPSEKLVVNNLQVPALTGAVAMPAKSKSLAIAAQAPVLKKLMYDEIDQLVVETAWVNNKLAFNDESFREVANKMERWYGIKVIFLQPVLEHIRFTGRFEDESIREALVAMQLTAKFSFSIADDTVIISPLTK